MMKTKNARRRPMTRTPTRPSSSGVAAFAAPGRAFESRQPGPWTRRISHGYRERKTTASRARLPRRRAEATCCLSCVAPRGFFFLSSFPFEKSDIAKQTSQGRLRRALFFQSGSFFSSSNRGRERESVFSPRSPSIMPAAKDSVFYGVYLLRSLAEPNSKRTYVG